MSARQVNVLNAALMLACCLLAHVAPADLLLASYAFLGPLHYLTQVSWMHDRGYSTSTPLVWLPLSLLGAGILLVGSGSVPGMACLGACLSLSAASVLAPSRLDGGSMCGLAALGGACGAAFSMLAPPGLLLAAILVPTVVHVFVFTGMFILGGALRAWKHDGTAAASLAVFLLCALSFAAGLPDWSSQSPWAARNVAVFADTGEALATFLGQHRATSALMGFVAYAYSYHYLNWFSKTSVIGWHRMGRRRLALVATLFALSTAAYLHDYRLGFALTLPLSLVHVLLELPLDMAVGHQLVAAAVSALRLRRG